MKKARTILLVGLALLVVLVVGFFTLGAIQKSKYDAVRQKLASELGGGLSPAALDDAKQHEISQWPVQSSAVGDNSPHAEALRSLGKQPTVENLVGLFDAQMQPYAWLDWGRNRQNLKAAQVQATLAPVSVDGKIHLSADGSTAIIIHSDGLASVFTDTEEGLRDEIRHRDLPDNP